MAHYLKIKVEGFHLNKLMDAVLKNNIELKNVVIKNEIEMVCIICNADFEKFKKLCQNTYKISIIIEKGYIPLYKKLLASKARILGIIVFVLLVYVQSLFISEIRIKGYEAIPETELRTTLNQVGVCEGMICVDVMQIKKLLFEKFDNIAHVQVERRGKLLLITISENNGYIDSKQQMPGEDNNEFSNQSALDKSTPCHIVASKDGYIEKIIPKVGKRMSEDGAFITKGAIMITGILPMQSTAYGTEAVNITEMYVHATGQVFAKIPERYLFFVEKNKYDKMETGNYNIGMDIKLGNFNLSSFYVANNFEVCKVEKIEKFSNDIFFPIDISLYKVKELNLVLEKKSDEEIKKQTEAIIRTIIKNNLPKKAQILNKSLNFVDKKNIIEVYAIIVSLQEIGMEQEIIIGE